MKPAQPPRRYHVPRGARPPRGVLWAPHEAVGYHAQSARDDVLRGPMPAQPARLEALRERLMRDLGLVPSTAWSEGGARWSTTNWAYYRGRHLACPYRCDLASEQCPVDVLLEVINAARAPRVGERIELTAAHRLEALKQATARKPAQNPSEESPE